MFFKFLFDFIDRVIDKMSVIVSIIGIIVDAFFVKITNLMAKRNEKKKDEYLSDSRNNEGFDILNTKIIRIDRKIKFYKCINGFFIGVLIISLIILMLSLVPDAYESWKNATEPSSISTSNVSNSDIPEDNSKDETATDKTFWKGNFTSNKEKTTITKKAVTTTKKTITTTKKSTTTTTTAQPNGDTFSGYKEFVAVNELSDNGILETVDGVYYQYNKDLKLFGIVKPGDAQYFVVHPIKLKFFDDKGNYLKNAEVKVASKVSYEYPRLPEFASLSKKYNGERVGLQAGYYYFWIHYDGVDYYSDIYTIKIETDFEQTYIVTVKK